MAERKLSIQPTQPVPNSLIWMSENFYWPTQPTQHLPSRALASHLSPSLHSVAMSVTNPSLSSLATTSIPLKRTKPSPVSTSSPQPKRQKKVPHKAQKKGGNRSIKDMLSGKLHTSDSSLLSSENPSILSHSTTLSDSDIAKAGTSLIASAFKQ